MKESCSGGIDDLAHARTEFCHSDCLTKHSAKPDTLIRASEAGLLPQVDTHPPFRDLMQHRAYWSQWLHEHLQLPHSHFACLSATFERVPSAPQLDTWHVTYTALVRLRVRPRLKLSVPTPSTCPVDISLLSVERCTHVEDVSVIRFKVKDVRHDAGTQPWGTTRWTGKTVFKISRDKRLHSQPLQSRDGKTTPDAKSLGNPIVSFATTVHTVFYCDTEDT